MTIVRPLEKIENFENLRAEVLDIINQVGFSMNQIVLQSIDKNKDEWHVGVGAIEELDEPDEKKYCHLNSILADTTLGKLIEKYKGYRSRIMLMSPRKCYSVHQDPGPRLHIPIVTNDQNWMIWPLDSYCVRLKPGFVYFTNTQKYHTFVNGSLEDRIHIVICIDPKFKKEKSNVNTNTHD